MSLEDLAVEVIGSNHAWYKAWVINMYTHSALCRFERNWKADQRVPFIKIRLPPSIPRSYQFKPNEEVEVYSASKKEEPAGWWPATIVFESQDGVMIQYRGFDSSKYHDIVNKKRIRPVTESKFIHQRTFLKFSREIPEKMRDCRHIPGVLDKKAFETFRKNTSASLIRYDPDSDEIVALSPDPQVILDVEKCFNYHLELLTKKVDMLLRNKLYAERLQITHEKASDTKAPSSTHRQSNRYVEEFTIDPNFMGLAIGTRGKNINKAREIPGIITLDLFEEQCLFKIIGETKDVVKEARDMLEFTESTIEVERRVAPKIIGKNGSIIQKIVDSSDCVRARVVNIEDKSTVHFVFVGTKGNLRRARTFMNSQIQYVKDMEEIVEQTYKHDTQLREKVYSENPTTASTTKAFSSPSEPGEQITSAAAAVNTSQVSSTHHNSNNTATSQALLTPRTPITPPYPVPAGSQGSTEESISSTTCSTSVSTATSNTSCNSSMNTSSSCSTSGGDNSYGANTNNTSSSTGCSDSNNTYSHTPTQPASNLVKGNCIETQTDASVFMDFAKPAPKVKNIKEDLAKGHAKSPRVTLPSSRKRTEPSPRSETNKRENTGTSVPRGSTARSRDSNTQLREPLSSRSSNTRSSQSSFPGSRSTRVKPSSSYKPKVDIAKATEKIGNALYSKGQTRDSTDVITEQEAAIEELVKAEAHSNNMAESKPCGGHHPAPPASAPVDVVIEKMEKVLPLDDTNDDKENARVPTNMNNRNVKVDNNPVKMNDNMAQKQQVKESPIRTTVVCDAVTS